MVESIAEGFEQWVCVNRIMWTLAVAYFIKEKEKENSWASIWNQNSVIKILQMQARKTGCSMRPHV